MGSSPPTQLRELDGEPNTENVEVMGSTPILSWEMWYLALGNVYQAYSVFPRGCFIFIVTLLIIDWGTNYSM